MTTYQIDPSHSSASFSIRHMMIAKVHGGFEKMSGKFVYDASSPAKSNIEVSIETASINTREAQRDAHLKSADFFDVEKYPTITFNSNTIEKTNEGYKVVGELNIHGVAKQVTLDMESLSAEVKDPWGNTKMAISGTTKIKRKDFGLTWNAALEAGGVLVGDDVSITLDVQLVKQV